MLAVTVSFSLLVFAITDSAITMKSAGPLGVALVLLAILILVAVRFFVQTHRMLFEGLWGIK